MAVKMIKGKGKGEKFKYAHAYRINNYVNKIYIFETLYDSSFDTKY